MTAPNPARDAQPGWRGTDPDGGTWVRLDRDLASEPWWYTSADGRVWGWRWPSQAEAANLVAAAPAPLDAGNPEHLRQVAEFVLSLAKSMGHSTNSNETGYNAKWLRGYADRIEQDAADRKRAEKIARERANGEGGAIGGWDRMRHDIREWHIGIAIDAIRAERARQEAEQ